jgi:hypothetical protein
VLACWDRALVDSELALCCESSHVEEHIHVVFPPIAERIPELCPL